MIPFPYNVGYIGKQLTEGPLNIIRHCDQGSTIERQDKISKQLDIVRRLFELLVRGAKSPPYSSSWQVLRKGPFFLPSCQLQSGQYDNKKIMTVE